jgi:hypothetical protein
MPIKPPEAIPTTSQTDLEQLRSRVWQEPELQARLWETRDRSAFIQLVVCLAEEHDLAVTTEEIEAALEASKRSWLQRWI